MKPVKRVEIVVEAAEINSFLRVLKKIGVDGYTLIRHVGGQGERGQRRPDEFVYEVENAYFIVACDEAQAVALVEAVRPMLIKSGGMCLVSDATWVIHKGAMPER